MANRRRYVRWQTDFEVKVKLDGALDFTDCRVMDLNFQGGQITTSLHFPRDSFFKIRLVFPGEVALDLEAWVAWEKIIDGYYVYGVYFSRIKDADKEKIYHFLSSNYKQEFIKKWWQAAPEQEEEKFMEDRRIFQRFAVKLPVNFLNLDTSKEGTAVTSDISIKGVSIVAHENLLPRTLLELRIKLQDDKDGPIYMRGQVAWSKPQGNDRYQLGINLENANLVSLSRIFPNVK